MKIQHNAHEVADAFKRLPESVLKEVDGALARGADEITHEARERAPKDSSALTDAIIPARISLLEHHITASKEYASFQEDGTGPGGWPSLDRIMAWMRRKGITPNTGTNVTGLAFLIRRSIARKGVPAQPFMQPAFDAVAPTLDARIRASVARGIAAVEPGRAL